MYKIYHLTKIKGTNMLQETVTDYDPMELEQAFSVVRELTIDAIENDSDDRWIVG